VAAAKAKDYSVAVLRLSLAAYRLARSIGIDGVYSRCIVATRGITAGSGFATSELRVLLVELMVASHEAWAATIVAALYVDDLTLATCGLPRCVINTMIRVIDFVVDWLERILLMEVSAKKSKVVAGKESIAVAIAQGTSTQKVSATTHLKLLGTDSVGGARRSTVTFKCRLANLGTCSRRYQALRSSGATSQQMVRTAAVPASMYGCEIFGLANSVLNTARSKIARAAAPEAGGKNPDLILMTLDGDQGTLDPAFEAHGSPIKHWAVAWWGHWTAPDNLRQAFADVARRCAGNAPKWQQVAGPTAALAASLDRIGWTMPSAHEVIDDLGAAWDFRKDLPAAILTAAKGAVRRWRLNRVGELLPKLIPATCDVGDPLCESTVLVSFGSVTEPIVNRRGNRGKKSADWEPTHRGDLVSAMSGGQWAQVRKCAVPSWHLTDNRCQLRLAEVGTLAHRAECMVTTPAEGWPEPPKLALRAMGRSSTDRLALLRTKAILVLRLPTYATRAGRGGFQMVARPDTLRVCQ